MIPIPINRTTTPAPPLSLNLIVVSYTVKWVHFRGLRW